MKDTAMSKIIADIGGTNARFALVNDNRISDVQVLSCLDYKSPADAAKAYLTKIGAQPETGAFAVATALDGSDRVSMTNHIWAFSIDETRTNIGLKKLTVVND